MILIIGLGNIGRAYKDTPHNLGFEFLNELRKELGDNGYECDEWKSEKLFFSEISKARKNGVIEYVLAKPTTFMNLSGRAVKKLVEKFKFDKVVIAHDDLDIVSGEYKIQVGKSPKSHNGIISIESEIDASGFVRVRLGADARGGLDIPGEKYVLQKMNPEVLNKSKEVIQEALHSLLTLLNQ